VPGEGLLRADRFVDGEQGLERTDREIHEYLDEIALGQQFQEARPAGSPPFDGHISNGRQVVSGGDGVGCRRHRVVTGFRAMAGGLWYSPAWEGRASRAEGALAAPGYRRGTACSGMTAETTGTPPHLAPGSPGAAGQRPRDAGCFRVAIELGATAQRTCRHQGQRRS
jgi:hypothetical protein